MSTDELNQDRRHPLYRCDICRENFSSMFNLELHKKSPEYRCDICGNILNQKSDLPKHKQRKHKSNSGLNLPFGCNICVNKYETQHALNRHMGCRHRFVCSICGRRSSVLREVKEHNMLTNNSLELDTHNQLIGTSMSTDKLNQNGRHPCRCDICEENFSSIINLEMHQASPEYKCDICGNIFIQKYHLYTHKRQAHESNSGLNRPFECNICVNKYRTSQGLSAHMHFRHRFKCFICGRRSSVLHEVEEHMLTHNSNPNGNTSFECENCNKSFPEELELIMHNTFCLPRDK